jgi:hypothetical protein
MARGFISHIAVNGAAIHDYELARIGATTESVARYVRSGEFGLWKETGELNDWIIEAAREGYGLGENVGRMIQRKRLSVSRLERVRGGVPVERSGDGACWRRLRHSA